MGVKTEASSGYLKVTRRLHYLMLGLCVVASCALFVVQSLLYKVTFTAILLAYAILLLKNSKLAALLFKIAIPQARTHHAELREWSSSTPSDPSSQSKLKLGESSYREEASIASLQRSLLRDSSFSSYKAVSSSHINDSHLATSRRRITEPRGHDLFQLSIFSEKTETRSAGQSSAGSEKEKGIVVLERKAIARKKMQSYRIDSQKAYQQQLAQIKKSAKYVQGKYQLILNSIHVLVNPLINEHKANTSKIIDLSNEFLEITIEGTSKEPFSFFLSVLTRQSQTQRITFQSLLCRFLQVYGRREPMELTKLPLKSGKRWNQFQKRINQLLRARLRVAEGLGVSTVGLNSRVQSGAASFIDQYNTHISMLEGYVSSDILGKSYQTSIQQIADESLVRQSKNRIYALYLYVKHLNGLLKGSIKITIKDYLGLKPLALDSETQLQISPKHSFDAYIPYFNLHIKQNQKSNKIYPCEYGTTNYLSLIYFLLVCLSSKKEVKDYPEVVRIINDIL